MLKRLDFDVGRHLNLIIRESQDQHTDDYPPNKYLMPTCSLEMLKIRSFRDRFSNFNLLRNLHAGYSDQLPTTPVRSSLMNSASRWVK